MEPFSTLTGIVAPLDALNVDTDQIIPKQFLKRIERTGYGNFLFFDWRYQNDGSTPNPQFEMNGPCYRGASILLTKDNFGCGSSREHAPWALVGYGFRAIIAPSFADIFYSNCINNGILPVVLTRDTVEQLFSEVRGSEGYQLCIDLSAQSITNSDGASIGFEIDPFIKERLLNGWDMIELTLSHEDKITEYERTHGLA